jgi:glycine betaine/proline transport system substrate-binding protein
MTRCIARILFVCFAIFIFSATLSAAGPDSCQKVHFSDVGWTDITSTTALTSVVLEGLGYKPKVTILSVPVTFASLKNKDIDIFLGLWLPSMAADEKPYRDDGSVERVRANLKGAKYTFAVPKYVYDAGIKNFAGNRLIQSMIDKNAFGLGGWKLVESSEQGMLSQVRRAERNKDWIVFLGWEPHPMNTNFKIDYLAGGDDYFGPNLGGATVHTNVRKGYVKECPNIGQLLKNLEFTLTMENQVMGMILDEGLEPNKAATQWLKKHPDVLLFRVATRFFWNWRSENGLDTFLFIRKDTFW